MLSGSGRQVAASLNGISPGARRSRAGELGWVSPELSPRGTRLEGRVETVSVGDQHRGKPDAQMRRKETLRELERWSPGHLG